MNQHVYKTASFAQVKDMVAVYVGSASGLVMIHNATCTLH